MKIWVALFVGFVVLVMAMLVCLNIAVHDGGGSQIYGMLVKKKSGETIYFPDACAVRGGEGKYKYLTWIADKNQIVYASVKNAECDGFYVCKTVPIQDKGFKFYTVTETDCKQEVANGRSK